MSRNGTCNLALTCAERMKMSLAVTALAMIRTRTSSGLGDGMGTWQTRSTSGGPYRSLTTAVIVGRDAIGLTSGCACHLLGGQGCTRARRVPGNGRRSESLAD